MHSYATHQLLNGVRREEATWGYPTTLVLAWILKFLQENREKLHFHEEDPNANLAVSVLQTAFFFVAWDLYLYGMHYAMHVNRLLYGA